MRLSTAAAFAFCVALGSAPAAGAWTWSAPASVSASGAGVKEPQVAANPKGDTVVAWESYSGGDWLVQASSREPGGAWRAPVTISTAGRETLGVRVAVAPSGRAVAVWERAGGKKGVIQAAWMSSRGAWSAPEKISEGGGTAQDASVAMDSEGDAFAVWERSSGASPSIVAAISQDGGPWGAPAVISAEGTSASDPQVAAAARGEAVAVWDTLDGPVQAASGSVGAGWAAPLALSSAVGDPGSVQVAARGDGEAVAVWQTGGRGAELASARRTRAKGWSTEARMSAGVIEEDFELRLAMNRYGLAALAAGGSLTSNTHFNTFIEGYLDAPKQSWMESERLGSGEDYEREDRHTSVQSPSVSVGLGGESVIAWSYTDVSSMAVQAAISPGAPEWLAPATLSESSEVAEHPQLASGRAGEAVAVWVNRQPGAEAIRSATLLE